MKILVTNDDGIEAPGLAALALAAESFGDVTVVAPLACRSSCGHQVTTDRPLRLEPRGGRRFALDGSPADCVRLALLEILPDADWVLAGVNDGANLGVDVLMSGTVAAVREASLLGRQAIALSQYRREFKPREWTRAGTLARQVLATLVEQVPPPGMFWNVNLPDPPEETSLPQVVHCDLDLHPLPVAYASLAENAYHYRGRYHDRPRRAGTDVDVCFSGQISVSLLRALTA